MARVELSDRIAGVCFAAEEVHGDERGFMVETYRREWFPTVPEMVQMNRADRARGCLVGLHFHFHQFDYWYVPAGRARIVLHDLRDGSPTDGATLSFELGPLAAGERSHGGVLIPPGVAHGFAALTDVTVTYLVTRYYDPTDELGVAWDDPDVAADWGLADPVLSRRDRENPRRAALTRRPAGPAPRPGAPARPGTPS